MTKKLEVSIDDILKDNVVNTYKEAQKQTRKKKNSKLKVTKGFTVTLTEDEFNALEQYCAENYISRNSFFRQLLREKMAEN
ncbi:MULTISPECIES: hypothetical protein [unclassified Campylobacter]|uniref:hypothetical protein n=1 Tax=unclassified Campylobacter TaxID=2593542 RepID=UPI001DF63970|nr:hypothetical protein [Campylobacter sp. RM12651]MBZ7978546.1 hypothetical protein [Campylobacter sp. RM12654]MBZ7980463.1 hypothetical protein [Campylobacter sp. RM12642]MBZ7990622.1 hypothetical protein [Campylobacter sp. RM9331]MBZ8004739.1 hypothetical protein [Campylobacter sp. RM9332]MBZ8007144.1 hypothetical protein [Campylobacter sp. RM9334]